MNKRIFRYIEPSIFFLLLTVTFISQFYNSLYLIKDFNWLAFLHHDLIYQIETFLLDMKFQGIEMLNSSPADYGSELYLLIPIYKFYELFISNPAPIHAYYFLTFIHLCCGISALFLIRCLIKKNQDNLISSTLLISVIVSSPLFIIYLSFVKPDSNVVLLCILVSFLSLLFFHERGENKWIWAALAASVLGTAVKWWGLFMLFPVTYAIVLQGGKSTDIFKLKHIYSAVIISSLILYVSCFLVVKNTVAALLKRGEAIFEPAFIAGLSTGKKFLYQTILFLHSNVGIAVSLGVFVLVAAACCVLVRKLSAYNEKLAQNNQNDHKTINYLSVFIKMFSVFTACYLILALPFLLSKRLAYSLYVFSDSLIFRHHHSSGDILPGIFTNMKHWLNGMWGYGFLLLFIFSIVIFLIYKCVEKFTKQDRLNSGRNNNLLINIVLIYLIPLTCFLFFFIIHTSSATLSMLFVLFSFFITLCISGIFKNLTASNRAGTQAGLSGRKRNFVLCLMLILLISQVAWQSFMSNLPPFYTLYTYRANMEADIAGLNDQLLNATGRDIEDGSKLLFLCKRDFPVDKKFNYRQMDTWACSNSEKLSQMLKPGNFLVLTEKQKKGQFSDVADSLLGRGTISLLSMLKSKKYTLEGFIFDYEAYVYYVN